MSDRSSVRRKIGLSLALIGGVGAFFLWGRTRQVAPVVGEAAVAGVTTQGPVTASASTPAPVAAAPAAPQTAPAPKLSAADFERDTRTVYAQLPRRKALRTQAADEVHGTPMMLREAAVQLGRVQQSMTDQPELTDTGLAFFDRCARDAELPLSLRATCLVDYRDTRRRLNGAYRLDDESTPFDADVRRLAEEIPSP